MEIKKNLHFCTAVRHYMQIIPFYCKYIPFKWWHAACTYLVCVLCRWQIPDGLINITLYHYTWTNQVISVSQIIFEYIIRFGQINIISYRYTYIAVLCCCIVYKYLNYFVFKFKTIIKYYIECVGFHKQYIHILNFIRAYKLIIMVNVAIFLNCRYNIYCIAI